MDQDYKQFVEQIELKTNIDLSLYKEAQMKRRLVSLYKKRGFQSFRQFYTAICQDEKLMSEFLDRITINVTEFFRNKNRWDVLEKEILPRLLLNKRELKIWSSASSTGEEPYTLAMILSRYLPLDQISILATDIDEEALKVAQRGIYTEKSITQIPIDLKKKYMIKEGSLYKVAESLKKTVHFKKMNLLADEFDTDFDLIVCRNVLIYFTEEAKDLLYRKFSTSLIDGGVLFVGSTEQIFNYSNYGFEVEESFFYKKIS